MAKMRRKSNRIVYYGADSSQRGAVSPPHPAASHMRASRRAWGQKKIILIGLTGGIGMGKSTVSAQFKMLGAAVHDADKAVHKVLAKGGAAVEKVREKFPEAYEGGAINRKKLGEMVFGKVEFDSDIVQKDIAGEKIKVLESIIHPLVRAEEVKFIKKQIALGKKIIVCDIPLLFETGVASRAMHLASARGTATPLSNASALSPHAKYGSRPKFDMKFYMGRRTSAQDRFDFTVTVSCPKFLQIQRVMKRPGMTFEKASVIIARQMPDFQKRRLASYVVNTGLGKRESLKIIMQIVSTIKNS